MTIDSTTRLRRFALAISCLQRVGDDHLDMRAWIAGRTVSTYDADIKLIRQAMREGSCGAKGCALGHMACDPAIRAEGLKLVFDGCAIPTFGGHSGFEAAQAFFGIAYSEATFMFDPELYEEEIDEDGYPVRDGDDEYLITVERVLDRLRTVRDRYVVQIPAAAPARVRVRVPELV